MGADTGMNQSFAIRGLAIDSDLGSRVAGVMDAVARETGRIMAPRGLTRNDFALLSLLLAAEEWTATQLAQVLPLAKSSISRSVTKLVNMGLVQRRRLLSDRRVVILSLTDEGKTLTRDLHSRVQAYDARLSEGVSEDEMTVFVSVTSKVMANYAAKAQPAQA